MKKISKLLARYFRTGENFVRLARMQAYKLKGVKAQIIEVFLDQKDGEMYVLAQHDWFPESVILWTGRRHTDPVVTVAYCQQPDPRQAKIYGEKNYHYKTAAYLRVA